MTHIEQDFAQRIREQGYRYTPQRQLILDALCEMGGHATVDDVYERVHALAPTVNLATVYRTMNFLEELNLVFSADIQGQRVYEIARPTPHHHLVCRRCGQLTTIADHLLDELVERLAREHDFEAELNHLAIPGLCGDCRRKTSEA